MSWGRKPKDTKSELLFHLHLEWFYIFVGLEGTWGGTRCLFFLSIWGIWLRVRWDAILIPVYVLSLMWRLFLFYSLINKKMEVDPMNRTQNNTQTRRHYPKDQQVNSYRILGAEVRMVRNRAASPRYQSGYHEKRKRNPSLTQEGVAVSFAILTFL